MRTTRLSKRCAKGEKRVAILDDEPPVRSGLRPPLETAREVTIVAEAPNGTEAVAAIRAHAPDVVFLDVQIPGMDGFEALSSIDAIFADPNEIVPSPRRPGQHVRDQ